MNTLMLAVAVRLAGKRIQPVRVLAGALIGAAAAQMAQPLDRQTALWLWLPVACTMMGAAIGRHALRRMIRHGLLLLCAAGLLGGTVLALSSAVSSLLIAYAIGALCMTIVSIHAVRARRAAQDCWRVRVICRFRQRQADFDAIIDSGNTLRDYLTHLPVIVVPAACARQFTGGAPLRKIFAETAGGRRMMDVFVPQEAAIRADGRMKKVRAAIALSEDLDRSAPALVPASLVAGDEAQ